jgi:16S rRNA G966 N2-methylase RsmD
MSKLKIDPESVHYISYYKDALDITNIICSQLELIGEKPYMCTITDTTAGVGGDVISFAQHFKHVNAIEVDKVRESFLRNNMKAYKFRNVKTYNEDSMKILKGFKQDVIFMDPPWGGKSYKEFKRLSLTLSDIPLEDICNTYLDKTKMIVLKLPLNYDLELFYNSIKANRTYVYELKRMYILVILNNKVKIKLNLLKKVKNLL